MDPTDIILWAFCIGLAWLLLSSLTGVDEWLKSLVGKKTVGGLESRVEKLEKRLDDLEKASKAKHD